MKKNTTDIFRIDNYDRFIFENLHTVSPKLSDSDDQIHRTDTKHSEILPHNIIICADVTQEIKSVECDTIISQTKCNCPVMNVPMMVRSKYCNPNIQVITRTEFIAGYFNQTAQKIHQMLDKCESGVIEIDEMYCLDIQK